MSDHASHDLIQWLISQGGSFREDLLEVREVENMGRGLAALKDIDENTSLFTIPRNLLLNTSTARLRTLLPPNTWDSLLSSRTWAALILSIVYEQANIETSPWRPYLSLMPTEIDSLLYWSDADLQYLKGSTIVNKIGKSDIVETYANVIKPILQEHPTLFNPSEGFSLERYLFAGSLVLSRSFTVLGDEEPKENDDDDSSSEAEDADATSGVHTVSMVPMADMLNAVSLRDNANLEFLPLEFRMMTTKAISAGGQVLNTFGNPPNADLLRRYGHVDYPNDNDDVEITADLLLAQDTWTNAQAKIEYLLDQGIDESVKDRTISMTILIIISTFLIEKGDLLPAELVISIKLLQMNDTDFEKLQQKGKLPKSTLEQTTAELILRLIHFRLSKYDTTLEVCDLRLPWISN